MTWGWFFGGFFRWIIRRICGRRTKLKDEIWGSIDGFFAKADGWILTENDILGAILIFIIIYIFSVIYL